MQNSRKVLLNYQLGTGRGRGGIAIQKFQFLSQVLQSPGSTISLQSTEFNGGDRKITLATVYTFALLIPFPLASFERDHDQKHPEDSRCLGYLRLFSFSIEHLLPMNATSTVHRSSKTVYWSRYTPLWMCSCLLQWPYSLSPCWFGRGARHDMRHALRDRKKKPTLQRAFIYLFHWNLRLPHALLEGGSSHRCLMLQLSLQTITVFHIAHCVSPSSPSTNR